MKKILKIAVCVLFSAIILFAFCGCSIFCEHEYQFKEKLSNYTCTENGYSLYECTKCGSEEKRVNSYAAHSTVTVNGYAATCTSDGKTDGVKCVVCNEIIEEQQIIPAAHNPIVSKQAVAPTCTQSGNTQETVCTVCGITVTHSVYISPLGHTEEKNITQEPTCTDQGIAQGSKCSVCGETISTDVSYIPATGHIDQNLDEICDKCGSLTGDDVVEISTIMDFKQIAFDLGGKYKLVSDIVLDDTWMPLGSQSTPFTGYLDGNGHTVTGLVVNNLAEGGIFVYNSGTVANLTVKTVKVSVSN